MPWLRCRLHVAGLAVACALTTLLIPGCEPEPVLAAETWTDDEDSSPERETEQDDDPSSESFEPLDLVAADCESTCEPYRMIIGCDDRRPRLDDTDPLEGAWGFIGKIEGASRCTGTLIGERHVLTAAHCAVDIGDASLSFALAAEGEDDDERPFGTRAVARVYVPAGFVINEREQTRALDIAVAELAEPIVGATPAAWGDIHWEQLAGSVVWSAGYPGTPPEGGPKGVPYVTNGEALAPEQPYATLDDDDRGLLYTALDGSGGQSGSPVMVTTTAGVPHVVGVMLGSPVHACEQGQNWAARLATGMVDHIDDVIAGEPSDAFWSVTEL